RSAEGIAREVAEREAVRRRVAGSADADDGHVPAVGRLEVEEVSAELGGARRRHAERLVEAREERARVRVPREDRLARVDRDGLVERGCDLRLVARVQAAALLA